MRRNEYTAQKEDWETSEMPAEQTRFSFFKHYSADEIEALKRGHIPGEMEDRWFAYFEENTLYIHRSWSGHCIYAVRFTFPFGRHVVTVNRNKEQYDNTDIREDRKTVKYLLALWSMP